MPWPLRRDPRLMRITSERDAVAPLSSAIANAYIDFS